MILAARCVLEFINEHVLNSIIPMQGQICWLIVITQASDCAHEYAVEVDDALPLKYFFQFYCR